MRPKQAHRRLDYGNMVLQCGSFAQGECQAKLTRSGAVSKEAPYSMADPVIPVPHPSTSTAAHRNSEIHFRRYLRRCHPQLLITYSSAGVCMLNPQKNAFIPEPDHVVLCSAIKSGAAMQHHACNSQYSHTVLSIAKQTKVHGFWHNKH